MTIRDGSHRREMQPVFLVYVTKPGESVEPVQVGKPFATLEDAIVAATMHAAGDKPDYTLDFEFHSDEVSDFYWAETEDEVMYTIHGAVPRSAIN